MRCPVLPLTHRYMSDKDVYAALNLMMEDEASRKKATTVIRSLIEDGSLYRVTSGIGSHWKFRETIPDSIQSYCPVCDTTQSFSQELHAIKGRELLEPVLPADRRTAIRDSALTAPQGAGRVTTVSP